MNDTLALGAVTHSNDELFFNSRVGRGESRRPSRRPSLRGAARNTRVAMTVRSAARRPVGGSCPVCGQQWVFPMLDVQVWTR